jgi:hypothetical protein
MMIVWDHLTGVLQDMGVVCNCRICKGTQVLWCELILKIKTRMYGFLENCLFKLVLVLFFSCDLAMMWLAGGFHLSI